MADDRLPIVFKGGVRNTLFVLAAGAAPVAGWLLIPGGLAILGLALSGIIRGCPRLELNVDGIAFTHCWRAVKRMAWRDLARVEVRQNARAGLENVALIPARGPTMLVGSLSAPANELRATIERVAAQIRSGALPRG